jgi:hypothetical protein
VLVSRFSSGATSPPTSQSTSGDLRDRSWKDERLAKDARGQLTDAANRALYSTIAPCSCQFANSKVLFASRQGKGFSHG